MLSHQSLGDEHVLRRRHLEVEITSGRHLNALTERFKALKAEFDELAADMEAEKRAELWAEVDDMNREVATTLLLGSLKQAIPLMEETISLAETVVASLKPEDQD